MKEDFLLRKDSVAGEGMGGEKDTVDVVGMGVDDLMCSILLENEP